MFPLIWRFLLYISINKFIFVVFILCWFCVWVCYILQPLTELSVQMDPAEADRMKQALSSQGALIGQHDATPVKVLETFEQLTSSVNRLTSGFKTLTS